MSAQTAEVVAAALSVIIAGVYSALTFLILRANRRAVALMAAQHEAATRPYMVVDVFSYVGSPLLKLRIRNVGNSAAENLQISIDKDFHRLNNPSDDYNLRNIYAFRHVIPSFAPRAELIFDLGIGFQIFRDAKLTPQQFNITATYAYGNRKVTEGTPIDLEMLHHTAVNPEPIVAELRSIKETLEKIAGTR